MYQYKMKKDYTYMVKIIARSALTEPHATAVTNIPKMTVSKNRISVHTLEPEIRRFQSHRNHSCGSPRLKSNIV